LAQCSRTTDKSRFEDPDPNRTHTKLQTTEKLVNLTLLYVHQVVEAGDEGISDNFLVGQLEASADWARRSDTSGCERLARAGCWLVGYFLGLGLRRRLRSRLTLLAGGNGLVVVGRGVDRGVVRAAVRVTLSLSTGKLFLGVFLSIRLALGAVRIALVLVLRDLLDDIVIVVLVIVLGDVVVPGPGLVGSLADAFVKTGIAGVLIDLLDVVLGETLTLPVHPAETSFVVVT